MRIKDADQTIQHYIAAYNMADFLNPDLLRALQLFRFPPNTNVYIEEDEQHYFYFLVEGQVQCHHYHLNGKLAVFAISQPFAAIGDVEILSEEKVASNVVSTQPTTMLGITSHIVHRYGADDPRFLRFLIDQLREKLYRTNAIQVSQVLPVISRLALYILSQPPAPDGVLYLPDKEGLASLLGTTTRHLNRVLNELDALGGITGTYPRVRIRDSTILHNLTV